MRYWLTAQWPRLKDDPAGALPTGVWIQDHMQDHARGMAPGDLLLIYEFLGGPKIIEKGANGRTLRTRYRKQGQRGIVAFERITSDLRDEGAQWPPEKADDGKTRWWRYHAATEIISTAGFVSWQKVNEILGYRPGCKLRGFGGGSGLMELSAEQFAALPDAFVGGGNAAGLGPRPHALPAPASGITS